MESVLAVLAGVLILAVLMLLGVLAVLAQNVERLRKEVADLKRSTSRLVSDSNRAVTEARRNLDAMSGVIDKADTLTGNADMATRFAINTVRSPLIRAVAWRSGLRSGWRKFKSSGQVGDTKRESIGPSGVAGALEIDLIEVQGAEIQGE